MSSVAIIVPYREQIGQNRKWELQEFTKYMVKYMNKLVQNEKIKKFHIYIIEQNYGKKFNRGMLLNIGYHLINDLYDIFIFHDIDLLPDKNLRSWYSYKYKNEDKMNHNPIHIANCWRDRYCGDLYFGGIVLFNKDIFEKINGFPNIFWGWGGEDDALYKRCIVNKYKPIKVNYGTIQDIEMDSYGNKMNLDEKLTFLKKNKEWKCQNKWECRDEDNINWRSDCLCNINELYTINDWICSGDYTIISIII